MSPSACVIVDTNILFSALLSRQSRFAGLIVRQEARFVICDSVIVELFEHKERIAKQSKHTETELLSALRDLLRPIQIYQELLISTDSWARAFHLSQSIDPADTPHIALTIELNGLLWTGDKRLKAGLQAKGFTQFFTPPTA
jgi:predicted nucleic acid-binding protein